MSDWNELKRMGEEKWHVTFQEFCYERKQKNEMVAGSGYAVK